MPLRVAVIGAGHIGSIHLSAYANCSEAQIVGVCDLIIGKAQQAAGKYGGRAYASVGALLSGEAVDAVSVCTAGQQNGSHHLQPVMQCFQAGVHVLCEKPLSNQLAEARGMAAKARQLGLYFGCDLNHRFTPQAQRARSWMDDGRIGQPLIANATLWLDNPSDRTPWMHLRALHPHSLDVLRYFCGPVRKVHAFLSRGDDGQGGERFCWSNAQINLLFASGVLGHLTGSYDADHRLDLERCEVMGTEGRFVIENCYQKATLYPRRSDELIVVPNPLFGGIGEFDETIHRRVHHWVRQLNDGDPLDKIDASGEDGLSVQEIIEAAIESWESGLVVDVANG